MTPEHLEGLIAFAMSSHGLIAQAVEDYRESNRPPQVADTILDRVNTTLLIAAIPRSAVSDTAACGV